MVSTTRAATDVELAARLRLAIGRLHRRIRVDSGAGLPPLQLSVLSTLDVHEPLRLSDLARREAVTPPTMSRVLGSLEEQGLVQRRVDPSDARSSLVSVTDLGRATLARIRTERTALLADRIDRLSPRHRAALAAALPALEAMLAGDAESGRATEPGRPAEPGRDTATERVGGRCGHRPTLDNLPQ